MYLAQGHNRGSNPQPLNLEFITLPLSHCLISDQWLKGFTVPDRLSDRHNPGSLVFLMWQVAGNNRAIIGKN